MKYNYLNIYNNLIKLTRNKNLYLKLDIDETFSERLTFFFSQQGMKYLIMIIFLNGKLETQIIIISKI